jgi:pimeloyl-ACP methyl ester carboxylesterase
VTRWITWMVIACAGALLLAAPASAIDKIVSMKSAGPGPPRFDHVYVHEMGPKDADRVLVLMPGTQGGAGDFTLLADELTKRIDGLAVWAIDRRSQVLEDTSMFERALDGRATLQEMFDYYLGWVTNGGTPADHYEFVDTSALGFAREWGMKTALDDARKVVLAAGKGGRQVILGGHSLGASLTAAYAAWDFNGKPGYRDVDGLVLIDGGLLGSFNSFDLAEAQQAMADLQSSNPFLDLFGNGVVESSGLFAETGAIFGSLAPTASAEPLQTYPLLPDANKPPVPVTNRALLGFNFDRDTSPLGADQHINGGGLAQSGDPRDWVDGGITPIERLTATFGAEPNAIEWFYPRRLNLDANGADQMKMNDVARYLGLRLQHTDEIDVPIYAFQTDLTDGAVLEGAKALVKRARTPKRQAMLVNGAPQASHLDPLTAEPSKNEFLKTVTAFLDPNG